VGGGGCKTQRTRQITIYTRNANTHTCTYTAKGKAQAPTLDLMPAASACRATLAARCMSSYDELVQLPMRPAFSSVGLWGGEGLRGA
jgi:hypothetical protein